MQKGEHSRKPSFVLSRTPERPQMTHRDSSGFRIESTSRSQENKRKNYYSPHNSPNKYIKIHQSSGSSKINAKPPSCESKLPIHYTPQNSPNRCQKTPQSSDLRLQPGSSKMTLQSSHSEGSEKAQKTDHGGTFLNALIAQWWKYTGVDTPMSHNTGRTESTVAEERRQKGDIEDRKIQFLQKKLQVAEETITSLSASHESELRAKEDILQQLNTDWELITKYFSEISESLKGFQEHKDNLTAMYKNISVVQKTTVKKLQDELNSLKLKDEERKHVVAVAESKIFDQEKRIEEMRVAENDLKKHLEDIKDKSCSEKNRLETAHAEEKLELIKKQEKLTSANEELQLQMRKIEGEKRNCISLSDGKDKNIAELKEEISTRENKVENLSRQNAELCEKYEQSLDKQKELSDKLQSTEQENERLRENLNTRQEIESSLAKDLDQFERKYKNTQHDFVNLENKLRKAEEHNANLKKTMDNMKSINELKLVDLQRKIEILEKEKDRILSDKRMEIQDLENSNESLRESHEVEVTALKTDFEAKLSEMKKTIVSQNSAFTKLNETLNKMKADSLNRRANIVAKEGHDKSQSNVADTKESFLNRYKNLETSLRETNKPSGGASQTKASQVFERKEPDYEAEKSNEKRTPRNKSNVINQEQDVYSFNTKIVDNIIRSPKELTQRKGARPNLRSPTEMSDFSQSQQYSHDKSAKQLQFETQDEQEGKDEEFRSTQQQKKIFKTRGAGLRQYGATRKLFKK